MANVFATTRVSVCSALLSLSACGDGAMLVARDADGAPLAQLEPGHEAHPHDADAHPIDGGLAMIDAGHAHADAAISSPSPGADALCPADYPAYRPGITARAQDLTVRLLAVDPSPPRQLVDNRWTIEIVDSTTGVPVDVRIASADTWMVVHRHGGRWLPTVVPEGAPGRFALQELDFKMRGPWAVRLQVLKPATTRPVALNLPICVE
jgi:hypothetical protein